MMSEKPVMNWFMKLFEDPDYLARFFAQAADSYSFKDHEFICCIEELPIFRELGYKRSSPMASDCHGNCIACEMSFLYNVSVYNITTFEGDVEDD